MRVYWLNAGDKIILKNGRSIRRKINSLGLSIQKKLKVSKIIGFPRHAILDLINVCGLNCPMCPEGRHQILRKKSRMSFELFKSIIDEIGPYLYTLTLTNWGEPLLHPELLKFLEYARKFPPYIGFSSNLQHMKHSFADRLLVSGINEIGCSIDGVTQGTYQQFRTGGDLRIALKNMIYLVERKHQLGLREPKIRWQVLLNRYTEKQTTSIIRAAQNIGLDSLVFIPIYVDLGRMFNTSPEERFHADKEWLPEDEKLSIYNYQTGNLKRKSTICSQLWDSIVIQPDGAISPCCAIINPDDDFGSIASDHSIRKAWNGKKYLDARKLFRSESGMDESTSLVCEHCRNNGLLI